MDKIPTLRYKKSNNNSSTVLIDRYALIYNIHIYIL